MRESANNIIEKATILFMQEGLQSVSMDAIASFCGISKKTLYIHFESKEILIEEIIQKLILRTVKFIRVCPDISPNAVNEMKNFSEHILTMLEILNPKVVRDLEKYYPGIYTQLIHFKDISVVPYIERCLNRGITEGIFRPDIDVKITGWFYCWQIQCVLEGDTSRADISQIFENANDLFLHGILNFKGLKLLSINKQNEKTRQKSCLEENDGGHFSK